MNVIAPYDGILPDGWTGGEAVTKRWRGDFLHLYRVRRACAGCGTEITLDVTRRALEGQAKNVGLLLRNCPSCRAARKAGGPGSRGGKSRPTAENTIPATEEGEQTKDMVITTMKAELTGLYKTVRELRDRLGKYELGPALAAAKESSKKMPWDG